MRPNGPPGASQQGACAPGRPAQVGHAKRANTVSRRAGDGIRTHDNDVGNVVLCQLSYTRKRYFLPQAFSTNQLRPGPATPTVATPGGESENYRPQPAPYKANWKTTFIRRPSPASTPPPKRCFPSTHPAGRCGAGPWDQDTNRRPWSSPPFLAQQHSPKRCPASSLQPTPPHQLVSMYPPPELAWFAGPETVATAA